MSDESAAPQLIPVPLKRPEARHRASARIYQGIPGIAVTEKIYRRRVSQTIYHDFDAEAPVLLLSAVRELLLSVSFHARERGGVRAVQKKLDNVLYIVVYYSIEQRIDPLFAARSASVEEYG